MLQSVILTLLALAFVSTDKFVQQQPLFMNSTNSGDSEFYTFAVNDLSGEKFSFEKLKGKRVLIVNTASECGFTPQYAQLQELYEEFGGEEFTIIGFPSNDFGGQEPGSNEEIGNFCQKNYGVTFPMMTKVKVKGEGCHEIYAWLTQNEKNGVMDAEVRWNFHKFLVDAEGNLVANYPSSTEPLDEKILSFAKGE